MDDEFVKIIKKNIKDYSQRAKVASHNQCIDGVISKVGYDAVVDTLEFSLDVYKQTQPSKQSKKTDGLCEGSTE
jgi:glycerol-3-phosphate cytidylyltransferase-like family protein